MVDHIILPFWFDFCRCYGTLTFSCNFDIGILCRDGNECSSTIFVLESRLTFLSLDISLSFLYARLETGRIMWLGMAGRRVCVHTGFRTITLVLYIGSLPNLATWFPCGRGRTLIILGSIGQRSRSLTINIIFDNRVVSTW